MNNEGEGLLKGVGMALGWGGGGMGNLNLGTSSPGNFSMLKEDLKFFFVHKHKVTRQSLGNLINFATSFQTWEGGVF